MSRRTYVIRDGELVPKEFAAPLIPPPAWSNGGPSMAPEVMRDIGEFVTQDKVRISSRSQLRAYEQSRGVKQIGNDWSGREKPVFWDAHAAKHGIRREI
jgi:hypothetical protein